MLVEPYSWRFSSSFAAHLFKAVARQRHHRLLPALRRCVTRDAIVIDVGAHVGQFARLFAKLAPDGRVYAIEPGSHVRTILRLALWARRANNVTVLPFALGDSWDLKQLNVPIKKSGSLGFGLAHTGQPENRWQRVASELVVQTTLDDLVARLGLRRLDFVKIDIEGNERRLLEGARTTLDRFRPRLMIELIDAHLARAHDNVAETFSFLHGRSYRPFVFGDRGLDELHEPCDADAVFLPEEDPLVRDYVQRR
ncbi:MAG: FkbM family methyltransferase [Alphaproteobacteria bacterium]|nr:FkbM family methyltransferase [Alphaproteobacteria bacterium]